MLEEPILYHFVVNLLSNVSEYNIVHELESALVRHLAEELFRSGHAQKCAEQLLYRIILLSILQLYDPLENIEGIIDSENV